MNSTKTNLDEIFYMDGSDLRWRNPSSNRVKQSDRVGTRRKDGYIQVKLEGKDNLAHRIVWEMHNGPIPDGMQIDHINHIRDDNRIENLRIVSNLANGMNQGMPKNNKSGVTGVGWYKKTGRWRVQIRANGKSMTVGYFDDFDIAVAARKDAESKYGFHENHGK